MIPDKRKVKVVASDFASRKHYEEYLAAMAAKPGPTDAQKLSQKENFALFQLKGIMGQLAHLMDVPGIGTINVEKVRMYCVAMEKNIKNQQQLRKNRKTSTKTTAELLATNLKVKTKHYG